MLQWVLVVYNTWVPLWKQVDDGDLNVAVRDIDHQTRSPKPKTTSAICSLSVLAYNIHKMNAERSRVVALVVAVKRHCHAWSTDSLCRECFQLH